MRIAAVFAALSLAAAAAAQTSAPAPFTYRTTVGEVLVQANVLDRHGRSVNGLPESDFTVYEDGVPQKIEAFSQQDTPVSIGILVDNSGSMVSERVQVDQAALNFVRAGNPGDETFVVLFNDEYHAVTPFTNSIPRLERGLAAIHPQSGTALYDTLIRAIGYMDEYGRNTKKVLLLITDGEDDASTHSFAQTLRLVRSVNAPLIYCIGLLDDSFGRAMEKEARRELTAFSAESGGVAYFPKNLKQVNAITDRVARDIRVQYSLIYRSNQHAAGYRRIRVVVRDPRHKHLTAHTRRGYVAGQPGS